MTLTIEMFFEKKIKLKNYKYQIKKKERIVYSMA